MTRRVEKKLKIEVLIVRLRFSVLNAEYPSRLASLVEYMIIRSVLSAISLSRRGESIIGEEVVDLIFFVKKRLHKNSVLTHACFPKVCVEFSFRTDPCSTLSVGVNDVGVNPWT